MANDIFCRIIKGEVPSSVVYEDDDVIAILDISQTTRVAQTGTSAVN